MPQTIIDLIECFKKFSGIGEKTAERMALQTLELDQDIIDLFVQSLLSSKTNIKTCKVCHNLTEQDICLICSNENRTNDVICVVEEPKNVFQFEKMGIFPGKYHVLGGLISPLNGVNPEDINIQSLVKRVEEENVKEVIIAVKPSIEGETTSLYISKVLKDKNVTISKLAHGIPLGADMDYIDPLTLELALDERKDITSS